MKKFIYIIAEGVLDVVFATEVLRRCFGGTVVGEKSALPQEASRWLEQFKWPVGDDIARKAVPAPAFILCGERFIAMRNAQGISRIGKTLNADTESFLRLRWNPDALCILLDADEEEPGTRFGEFAALIENAGYPRPESLDVPMENNGVRSAVFSFPGDGQRGTLEDVLRPLACARFPGLAQHAERYVETWIRTEDAGSHDFKELRRPAAKSKALLSSMTALLKPGKSIIVSLEDQNWIPEEFERCDALVPFLRFLKELL